MEGGTRGRWTRALTIAVILVVARGVEGQIRRPPDVAVRIHARPEAVDRVLAAARASSSALAIEMGELRREAIPAAFGALVRVDPFPSTEVPREALVAALGRVPRRDLRLFFDGLCAAGASAEERRTILLVVADSGSAGDLAAVPVWVSEPACTEEAFTECVRALLARDARSYAYLPELLPAIPALLRPALVRGVAAARSELGMRTLASSMESERDLALLAIVHIGRMANGMPRPIDEGVRSAVRRCLADGACAARPEAALTAGELDDDEAIPLLIDLLADDSRGLRANALWSLQRLSGLRMREEPERWRAWHELEVKWWREQSAQVIADLRSGSVKSVHAALESIAGIRTGRERLVVEVSARLRSKNPSIVTQACVVLGRLGSATALPGLTELLDDPDPLVRASARDALKAIDGFDLPDERKAPSDPR
jgi:hypothetical protein